MDQIFTPVNNFKLPFIKLISIAGIVIIEFTLLLLFALEYYKVSVALLAFIFSSILLYLFFNKPLLLLHTFLLSILAGAIDISNFGSKESPISFVNILFPVLVAFLFIKIFFESSFSIDSKQKLIKNIFIVFLIWSLFTALTAINKTLSLAYWKNYFTGFIVFYFTSFFVRKPGQFRTMLIMFIIWGVILALIEFYILGSLGGLASGITRLFIRKNLLATTWGKSNYLAAFYVLIIPITMGYFLSITSRTKKLFLFISLLLMFAAMIITFSRGGILSFIIAVLVLISRVMKPKIFIPLLLLMILASVILILNPYTYAIFEGISKVEKSFSYMTRLNFYEDVWNTFKENPVTGVGFGNLGYFAKFKITNVTASAHNIVLGLLGETGIMGAVLFISLLLYAFILCLRNYLREKNEKIKILQWSFISAFVGVLFHSMMEPNFEGFQFASIFWATLAIFIHLGKLSEEQKLSFLEENLTTAS